MHPRGGSAASWSEHRPESQDLRVLIPDLSLIGSLSFVKSHALCFSFPWLQMGIIMTALLR